MRRLTFLLILLEACETTPAEDETPCVDFFPSECAQETACAIVEGFVVTESEGSVCVDYTGDTLGLACDVADRSCLAIETLAASADDPTDCYLFPDSCIPDGWGDCEEVSEVPPEC